MTFPKQDGQQQRTTCKIAIARRVGCIGMLDRARCVGFSKYDRIVIAADVFRYPVVGTSCGGVARKPAPARRHLDQLCRSSSTLARSVMMPNTRCVVARSSIVKS